MAEHVPRNASTNEIAHTGDSSDAYEDFDRLLRICAPLLYGIILLLGITGNGAVIYTGFRRKNTFNNINKTLVTFLALVDFCFLVICLPFDGASYIWNVWPFGETWCKISFYFTFSSATLSSGILALMSVDRFTKIVYPLSSMHMRRTRNIRIALLCICVASLGVNVPALFLFNLVEYTYAGEYRSECVPVLTSFQTPAQGMNLRQIHYLIFGVFGYLVPLLLIVAMYGGICVTLSAKKPTNILRAGPRRSAANVKAVKFVFVIVLTFFLCWTPLQISQFLVYVLEYFPRPLAIPLFAVLVAAQCLAFSNSCMNPLLYTCMSGKCRQKLCREPSPDTTVQSVSQTVHRKHPEPSPDTRSVSHFINVPRST